MEIGILLLHRDGPSVYRPFAGTIPSTHGSWRDPVAAVREWAAGEGLVLPEKTEVVKIESSTYVAVLLEEQWGDPTHWFSVPNQGAEEWTEQVNQLIKRLSD